VNLNKSIALADFSSHQDDHEQEISDIPCTGPPSNLKQNSVFVVDGDLIKDIWSKRKAQQVYQHLSNDNAYYVMGFRNEEGNIIYRRAKTKSIEDAISWSISTAFGTAKSPFTVAFYANNDAGKSRWGGLDFDCHDGASADRAYLWSRDAFRLLVNEPGMSVIWEYSGRGYHCWAVCIHFRPVQQWIAFLKQIAFRIGAEIGEGKCEIFPADTIARQYGHALRAPGSWNPKTGTPSRIFFDNLDPLLESTVPQVNAKASRRRRRASLLPNELHQQLHDKIEQVFSILREESSEYMIQAPATRHQKLKNLIGKAFWYVGQQTARILVAHQYDTKLVSTEANRDDHLHEFENLWKGMVDLFIRELPPNIKASYDALATENERDAFRIIRSFAHGANSDNKPDFPIAVENLGKRLGITYPGASKIRQKLTGLGVIHLSQPHIPNSKAATYVWPMERA